MPEALALYCRIMHAVAPPKAAALLSAASTAGRSQQKQPDGERHPKASAPDVANSHMGQILVHPLDSLDWTAVSAEQGQEHASVQALSLVSCLDNQAPVPDTLQFRYGHATISDKAGHPCSAGSHMGTRALIRVGCCAPACRHLLSLLPRCPTPHLSRSSYVAMLPPVCAPACSAGGSSSSSSLPISQTLLVISSVPFIWYHSSCLCQPVDALASNAL